MTSMKKRIAAALTAATLAIVLTIPTMAAESPDDPVRMSSYKGSTLEVGKRSGLIIGPSGADYTVTSSDPDTVAVEQVLHVRRDTQQCQLLCVTKYQSGEAVQVTGRPLLIDNETECRTENITPGSTDFLLKYCIAENKE